MISPISAGGGFTRTGIGTIVDMDSLEVEVDVNEAYIGRVQPKMPVEAMLNAYPGMEDPRRGDRDHPDRRPQQGDGEGARRAERRKDPRIVPDMGVRVSFLEADKPGAAKPNRRAGAGAARCRPAKARASVFVVRWRKGAQRVAVTARPHARRRSTR